MNWSKRCIFFIGHLIHLISALDYKNVNQWVNEYPNCGGESQSPIVLTADLQHVDQSKALVFKNYDTLPIQMMIKNTGRTVELNGYWRGSASAIPTITFDGIEYEFLHVEFHWGTSDDSGSEHEFEGKNTPLEIQIIHWDYDLGDFDPERGEGILILAVLCEISNTEPMYLWNILDVVHTITKPDFRVEQIWTFKLNDIIQFPHDYYLTYSGSLTTPPCTEGVTWVILDKPAQVTKAQMESFRTIIFDDDNDHNNRPTQPINQREVTAVPT